MNGCLWIGGACEKGRQSRDYDKRKKKKTPEWNPTACPLPSPSTSPHIAAQRNAPAHIVPYHHTPTARPQVFFFSASNGTGHTDAPAPLTQTQPSKQTSIQKDSSPDSAGCLHNISLANCTEWKAQSAPRLPSIFAFSFFLFLLFFFSQA